MPEVGDQSQTFGKVRSDKGRPDGCQDAIDLASERVFGVENSNLAPDKISSEVTWERDAPLCP